MSILLFSTFANPVYGICSEYIVTQEDLYGALLERIDEEHSIGKAT
jgi:hypothetical protein